MSAAGRIAGGVTRALAAVGAGGLYDLGPLGTLVIPDGGLEPDDLTRVGEPWFRSPPSSPTPFAPIDEAFDPGPRLVRESRVVELRDVRVIGSEGAVLDARSGRLWYPSASSRASVVPKLERPRRVRLLPPARREPGPLAVLPTFRSDNYFHFVTDVLTRLYAFRGAAAETTLVLDAAEPAWQAALVRLLGFEPRLEPMQSDSHWRVERLLFPTFVGVKHPVSELTLFPPAVLEWLGETVRRGAGATPSSSRRLYVSRSAAGWRRVVNDGEVQKLLVARGYEVVQPERLDAVDQVRLFAQAAVVVGPHGAGLSNLVFAGPGTTIVELHTPQFHSACYYGLADALGHEYRYVLGEPAGRDYDFSVPLDALEEVLP